LPARSRQASQEERREAAEQELQAFSYFVCHDLSAPLRHVSEFSRLLLDELGVLTDRQQAFADHILAASAKSRLLLDQLLTFSRVQQKTLETACLDASLTLRLALLQLSGQVQAAGAELSVEPLGEVEADAELLALSLHHLLDNAIKFRRPGVRPRVVIQAAHDKAFWRMRIADNGIGVEPANRERAFQMFQRLNGETAFPGVGAGLTICRRIARRHGGEVGFVDHAQGACVELALPRVLARERIG
jgi:light-regulated signal transduction histidine kinase (bacteriophytochrome)